MSAKWPGKGAEELYASPFLSAEVGNFTDVVCPPPIILVCAITRVSPFLM